MNQHVSRCHPRASTRGAKLSNRGRARHRGQALLMAVLLMVFAALLGSTFITVVALNLSQTSRNESKRDAELAARAAIEVTNAQLTNSTVGEKWRPEMINPPPAKGDADYNEYYTAFEQAQGWGRTVPVATINDTNPNFGVTGGDWNKDNTFKNPEDDWAKLEYYKNPPLADAALRSRVFVKFPDPREPTFSRSKTPSYLVEVAPATGAQAGALRIEVIGRADDNDAAFYRSVVYKGTSQLGGPLAFARYDANYDTQKNTLRATRLTAAPGADADGNVTLTVQDSSFFVPGQTILVAAGTSPTSDRETAVVRSVNSATSQLTLNRTTLPGTFPIGTQVRAASRLLPGLLSADFDADGDGTPGETTLGENTVFEDSVLQIERSNNGMYFGGGLALDGQGMFQLNGAATTDPKDDDTVLVAGQIAGGNADLRMRQNESTTTVALFPNSETNSGTGVQKLVRDDISSGETGVRPIAPPRLEGQNGKPSRYVELTKLADLPRGSQYGYGPGIYIDNREDIEKVRRYLDTTVTPNRTLYRALKISDMHRLWQRKSFPVDTRYANEEGNIDYDAATGNTGALNNTGTGTKAHRLVPPRPSADAYTSYPVANSTTAGVGSLEERGVRGWINQYEFLPRGALIELVSINATTFEIIVTRDDRSDGVVTNSDRNKAWRDTNGALIPQSYRMRIRVNNVGQPSEQVVRYVGASGYDTTPIDTYPGPFNGVIAAEGNVRVRGSIGNKDITIASMGNIYIEGSVRRNGNGRIALLAKNNVTLNPTQFLARPAGLQHDGYVTAPAVIQTSGVSAGVDEISVPDVTRFRVGDRVSMPNSENWLVVQSVTFANTINNSGTVKLATNHGVATGDPITNMRLFSDAAAPTVNLLNQDRQYTLANSLNPLVRDVLFDGAAPTATTRLSWRHAGTTAVAFNMQNTSAAPNTFAVKRNTYPSAPEVISGGLTDNEKFLYAASPTQPGLPTAYNLLDLLWSPYSPTSGGVPQDSTLPPDGNTADGDSIETLQVLKDNFTWRQDLHGQGMPFGTGNGDTTNDVATEEPNPDWDITGLADASAQAGIAARRIAAIPLDRTVDPGVASPVLFTLSLGQFWRPDLADMNASPRGILGSSALPADPESFETAGESFYGKYNVATNTYTAADLLPHGMALTTPNLNESNLFALRHEFGYTGTFLPGYRFTRPKLEDSDFSTVSTDFQPGMNIDIDATIFAQEGSWFVIPVPMDVVAPVDSDNSGAIEASEQDAARAATTRYRRLNYRIAVRGTIAQNMTPTGTTDYDFEQTPDQPVTDTTSPGAMQQWIDSLSHPTTIVTSAGGNRGGDWMGIYYRAAPLNFSAPDGGAGLYLPVSPDLMYVG